MSWFCNPLMCGVCVLISMVSGQVAFATNPGDTNPGDTRKVLSAIKSQRLDDRQFERLTQFIKPNGSEEKWRETPWIPSIHEGRKISARNNKPIFLWAMNGDPLGCV